MAGYHEVVYTDATKATVERKKQEMLAKNGVDKRQWRVSSTTFNHFRNDVDVAPLSSLRHLYLPEQAEKYPKNFTAYDLLMQELNATGMNEQEEKK
jgi:hypothetical protein